MPAFFPACGIRRAVAGFTREDCHHDLARQLAHGGAVHLSVLRADQARKILTTRRLPLAGPHQALETHMNDLIFVVVTLAFFMTSAAFIVALGKI
jgi:hypothetical protein